MWYDLILIENGFKKKVYTSQYYRDSVRNRCKVDSDSGAVYIEGPDGKTKIADDTWRTAGDAQKVASGFGDDMKKCVAAGVDKDRQK